MNMFRKIAATAATLLLTVGVMSAATLQSADASGTDEGPCITVVYKDDPSITAQRGDCSVETPVEQAPASYVVCYEQKDTFASLRERAAAGENVGASVEYFDTHFDGERPPMVLVETFDADCNAVMPPELSLVNDATGEVFTPFMAGSNAWFSGVSIGQYTVTLEGEVVSPPGSLKIIVGPDGYFNVGAGSFMASSGLVVK